MAQTLSYWHMARLVRTVGHLKPRQIAGQIRYRTVHLLERYGSPDDGRIGAYAGCAWPEGVVFLPPGPRDDRGETIQQGTFEFLNVRVGAGFPPQWEHAEASKLWKYNLHYFEWLWRLDYEDARMVVGDWIRNHSLTPGAVGWEPYPTSLRLMNWCAVFWGRFRRRTEEDEAFLGTLWNSIGRQARWLARHLETHLLGNHYLDNGAALAFVGSCFVGESAREWLGRGERILREQIVEQILPDGMHCELSPMYHCRVIYTLLLLMATGDDRLKDLAGRPLARMVEALGHVCHPDGGIALLNDSAFGVYNEPAELRSWAHHLLGPGLHGTGAGAGGFALTSAGCYGWRDSGATYIIADFGRGGPDHILGHSHADMLSFELSVRGRRVIVDSGVHDYEVSAARSYCRSTAAHNTVEVDGQDQCEMWAAFRVARRGRPHGLQWEPGENGFVLSAWHDGYRRLPGRPVHSRTMRWDASGCLNILDRVSARRNVRAVSRLHLHPDCSVERMHPLAVRVLCGEVACRIESTVPLTLDESFYCPEFGVRQPNQCICATGHGAEVEIGFTIHCPPV